MSRLSLPLHLLLAFLLALFLAMPHVFTPLLSPFTRNGAPAIYDQTPLWRLAVSHLGLVATATGAAAIVAVGFAVLTTRPSGKDFLPLSRAIANIGQTFPPVAVLALAVPIFGFGAGPTLIALFLYALLPIFEMTLTGFQTLPARVVEAGRGMGMRESQLLWQVELPLVLPSILAGLRLASIISLATATIGSTVAARSLGEVILAGIFAGNTAFVLQGAFVVGSLAVLTNGIFLALEERVRRA